MDTAIFDLCTKGFVLQSNNSLSMLKTPIFCCLPNNPSSQLLPASHHSPCMLRLHAAACITSSSSVKTQMASVVPIAPDSTRKALQKAKNKLEKIAFGILDLQPFSCWH